MQKRLLLMLFSTLLVVMPPANIRADKAQEIAFVRDGDIYLTNTESTEEVRLTTGEKVQQFAWSPDGTRLAFVSKELFSGWYLGVLDIATGKIYPIHAQGGDPYGVEVAWAPDSRHIAFTRDDADPLTHQDFSDVYVADPLGTVLPRRLSSSKGYNHFVLWMSDSRQLIFNKISSDYYIADIETGISRPLLLEGPANDSPHAWSSDGRMVISLIGGLFIGESTHFILRNLETHEEHVFLQPTRQDLQELRFSPDEEWISYRFPIHLFGSRLGVVNLESGHEQFIFPDANNVLEVSYHVWSPDSTKIAYIQLVHDFGVIYVADVRTGQSQRVTPETGSYSFWDWCWSPDSQRLAYIDRDKNLYMTNLNSGKTHRVPNVDPSRYAIGWRP